MNKTTLELLQELNTMQNEHIKVLEERIEVLKNTISIQEQTIEIQNKTINNYLNNKSNG
tara:strand:+ start:2616 stop:2792 length:177 start_codon:yes stop_codon:yes gene_type:complete